jgi:hypothetical protein
MQAIVTKYYGPTNHRGSRIKATAGNGASVTIPYPHELNIEAAHRKAAETLLTRMGWTGRLIAGGLSDGYVFVFAEDDASRECCRLVLEWAKTPGEHGGNPYCHPFVRAARKALGNVD